jgi:hypothetical protein
MFKWRHCLSGLHPVGGSQEAVLAGLRLEYCNSAPDDYTNGISAQGTNDWQVRDNRLFRIRAITNDPIPRILFCSGSSGMVPERKFSGR